ncbi:type IV pilus modification PilV family protein [Roseateles chitinivorans]|uniref:type IV pilus modification PilV family protein n=1 Tax=Roseateles chitinivorans TaxID=2917965 RepID=UPI003D66B79E
MAAPWPMHPGPRDVMKPMFRPQSTRRAGARGMTLIELMVAMLVMTIGIVGLVTLMARASQASSSTEDNLRAAVLASDIVNDMWTSNVPNPRRSRIGRLVWLMARGPGCPTRRAPSQSMPTMWPRSRSPGGRPAEPHASTPPMCA